MMRGPDWQDGDKDGGEGHLGTLTQLLGDGRVQVLWDKGEEGTCSAGTEGRFDLRIFDTAQAGESWFSLVLVLVVTVFVVVVVVVVVVRCCCCCCC